MLSKVLAGMLFSGLLLLQVGCVDDDSTRELSRLNNQLNRLLEQFENAEQNFGPSANSDSLVQNAHWLDRMINYNKEIANIERKAVALGADPISDLICAKCNCQIQSPICVESSTRD